MQCRHAALSRPTERRRHAASHLRVRVPCGGAGGDDVNAAGAEGEAACVVASVGHILELVGAQGTALVRGAAVEAQPRKLEGGAARPGAERWAERY